MSKTNEVTKDLKLRAVLDGRHLAPELFGSGASHIARKLVWLYIASFADPNGTGAYPGRETIAADTGLTKRTITNITEWLEQHHLLAIARKASPAGTNLYTLLFDEDAQEACRAALAK